MGLGEENKTLFNTSKASLEDDPKVREATRKMSAQQIHFANLYLAGKTAKEAFKAAGYSVKGGDAVIFKNATRLLNTDTVRAYIEANKMALNKQFSIDRHQFAEELKKAFLGEWEEEQIVLVSNGDYTTTPKTIKKAISTRDRLKAAEILERVFRIIDDAPLTQSPETAAIVDFAKGISKNASKDTEIDTQGRKAQSEAADEDDQDGA